MSYKGVVFDYDYTLGDCTSGIVDCVNTALKKMDQQRSTEDVIRKSVGMTLINTYHFITNDSSQERAEEFKRLFMLRADDVMAQSAVFLPYAKEVIEQLKEDQIRVGIVTTKHRHRVTSIFELLGVPDFVKDIIGGEDVSKEKPDPEGLNRMIDNWNLDKNQVLYVGDSMVDAMTAQHAGVDFAAVTTGTTGFDDFKKADYKIIMEDLRPIITLVRS